MRDLSGGFIPQKNAEQNKPTTLYRINLYDDPETPGHEDWFLTDNNEPITYYKEDDDVFTVQEYAHPDFAIKHGPITNNLDGTVDAIRITVSNVNRQAQAFLEDLDALRGRRVTIWRVFRDALEDPDDHAEDIYYIDGVSADSQTVEFDCRSKLDVMDVQLPLRSYYRNDCQNTYKQDGCWLNNGDGTFSPPGGFEIDKYHLFDGEGQADASALVFNGVTFDQFPALSFALFQDVALSGFGNGADELTVDLWTNDRDNLLNGAMSLTSNANPNTNWVQYNISDWKTILPNSNAWHTITFPMSLFSATSGTFNPNHANYFRIWAFPNTTPNGLIIKWRNLKMKIAKPSTWITDLDRCSLKYKDCKRHNNTGRFLAFPAIPKRDRFQG